MLIASTLWLLVQSAAEAPPIRDRSDLSCSAKAAHLLILGSYHMNNPGLDAVNLEADDVLAPRRQAEIAALNAALLRYRPTKVAVEGDRHSGAANERYREWIEGRRQLSRSESEQVGMRVARAAGHRNIYPVDFPMMMSGLRYDEVEIKPKPKPNGAATKRALTDREKLLRRQTVIENLRQINQTEAIAADHRGYMDLLEPDPADSALYAKSDLLLNWYKRNIRMMANIGRISGPGDRVLLIVGSGHLAILRDFAMSSPHFCLADTMAYLGHGGR